MPRGNERKDVRAAQSAPVATFAIAGTAMHAAKAAAGLHLVATPIGNLADISLRALQVLAGVDMIACEDTRLSRRLLDHYAITAKLLAYHDHNGARQRPALLKRLGEGAAIALISDAGTPLVSDPGYKLVTDALAHDIAVHVVPGASAALAGLLLSGLPSDRFFFAGFLPPKQAARRKRLEQLAAIPGSLIVYESASRLAATLADMTLVLGPRDAAICREISKIYEDCLRAPLGELGDRIAATPVRGEIVIVVAPPGAAPALADDDVDRLLLNLLAQLSMKDAASEAARRSGLKRRDLYERALTLTSKRDAQQ